MINDSTKNKTKNGYFNLRYLPFKFGINCGVLVTFVRGTKATFSLRGKMSVLLLFRLVFITVGMDGCAKLNRNGFFSGDLENLLVLKPYHYCSFSSIEAAHIIYPQKTII